MDGNCNVESVIYQAEVTTETTKETYIGLCDTAFKLRYRNYVSSFRNERDLFIMYMHNHCAQKEIKEVLLAEFLLGGQPKSRFFFLKLWEDVCQRVPYCI